MPRSGEVWRERPVDKEAEVADQSRAIGSLVAEARQYYRSGTVSAAKDFHTVNVPAASGMRRQT